ncbi:hypothetical protein BCR44DRAFT_1432847 [Catenaria anguillulae PL171]|uniref:Uncharacterized protein n=1 Tax=Catenaria anguillulae PL171 TaxID=765915 RepID=A0A1Y2HNF3_9FUNG|nr:hypothetical protein BCR44DRAFT_1432847 [Catenaria anguillulae PL171]
MTAAFSKAGPHASVPRHSSPLPARSSTVPAPTMPPNATAPPAMSRPSSAPLVPTVYAAMDHPTSTTVSTRLANIDQVVMSVDAIVAAYSDAPLALHQSQVTALAEDVDYHLSRLLDRCAGAWFLLDRPELVTTLVEALDPESHHPLFDLSVMHLVRLCAALKPADRLLATVATVSPSPTRPPSPSSSSAEQSCKPADVPTSRLSTIISRLFLCATTLLTNRACFHAALTSIYALLKLTHAHLTPKVQQSLLSALLYWNPLRPHVDPTADRPHLAIHPTPPPLTSPNGSSLVNLTPAIAYNHIVALILTVRDKFGWRELSPDVVMIAPSIVVDHFVDTAVTRHDVDAILYCLGWDASVQAHSPPVLYAQPNQSAAAAVGPIWMHPKLAAWLTAAHESVHHLSAQLLLSIRTSPASVPVHSKLAVIDAAVRAHIPATLLVPLMDYLTSALIPSCTAGTQVHSAMLLTAFGALHHADERVRVCAARALARLTHRTLTHDGTDEFRLANAFTATTLADDPSVDWHTLADMSAHLAEVLGDWPQTVRDPDALGTLAFLAGNPRYLAQMATRDGMAHMLAQGMLDATDAAVQSHLLDVYTRLVRPADADARVLEHAVLMLVTPSAKMLRIRALVARWTRPTALPNDRDAYAGSCDPRAWGAVRGPEGCGRTVVDELVARYWVPKFVEPVARQVCRSHAEILAAVHELRLVGVHPSAQRAAVLSAVIREGGVGCVIGIEPAGDEDAECQLLIWKWLGKVEHEVLRLEEVTRALSDAVAKGVAPLLVSRVDEGDDGEGLSEVIKVELATSVLGVMRRAGIQIEFGRADDPLTQFFQRAVSLVPDVAIKHAAAVTAMSQDSPALATPHWLISAAVQVLSVSPTPDPSSWSTLRAATHLLLCTPVLSGNSSTSSSHDASSATDNITAWLDPRSSSLHYVPRLCSHSPDHGWLLATHLARAAIFVPELRASFAAGDPVAAAMRAIDLSVAGDGAHVDGASALAWMFMETAAAWQPGAVEKRVRGWRGWGAAVKAGVRHVDWRVRAAVIRIVARVDREVVDDEVIVEMARGMVQDVPPIGFPAVAVTDMTNDVADVVKVVVESRSATADWFVFAQGAELVSEFCLRADLKCEAVVALACCVFYRVYDDAQAHLATRAELRHALDPFLPMCRAWLPELAGLLESRREVIVVVVQLVVYVLNSLLACGHGAVDGEVSGLSLSLTELAPRLASAFAREQHVDQNEQALVCRALELVFKLAPAGSIDPAPVMTHLLESSTAQPSSTMRCSTRRPDSKTCPAANPSIVQLLRVLSTYVTNPGSSNILHHPVILVWFTSAVTSTSQDTSILDLLPLAIASNRDAQVVGTTLADAALGVLLRADPACHKSAAAALHVGTARPGTSNPLVALVRAVDQRLSVSPGTPGSAFVGSRSVNGNGSSSELAVSSASQGIVESSLRVLVTWTYYIEAQRKVTAALAILTDCACGSTRTRPTFRSRLFALCVLRNAALLTDNKSRLSDDELLHPLLALSDKMDPLNTNATCMVAAWLQFVWTVVHANHRPSVVAARSQVLERVGWLRDRVGSAGGPHPNTPQLVDSDLLAGKVQVDQLVELLDLVEQAVTVAG